MVGAGSMSSLAVAAAERAGRRRHHGRQPDPRTTPGGWPRTVCGHAADLTDLPALIAAADLVISCTGAPGA